MTISRMVWIACGLCVIEVGCSPSGSSKVSVEQKSAVIGAANINAPRDRAETFVRDFLNHVQKGQANASVLSTGFKKVIARPVFPSEMSQGYSDVAAADWLKRFQNQIDADSIQSLAGGDEAPAFVGQNWVIRLVADANSWKVDWLGVGPTSWNPSQKGSEAFVVSAFLTAVLARQEAQASALMTLEFKQQLAPPLSADKTGFNQGLLKQRLDDLREQATSYSIVSIHQQKAQVELISKVTRRKVTLQLTRGERPWEWFISEYKLEG